LGFCDLPRELTNALEFSDSVFSAWNGEKLLDLLSAITDHSMVAYYKDQSFKVVQGCKARMEEM
jgi:hypothetical protein